MEYYTIDTNLDHVGMVPQLKDDAFHDINRGDIRSPWKMSFSNKETPVLGEPELHWKGKWTDVVWNILSNDKFTICVSNRMLITMKEEITFKDYSIYPFTIRKRKSVEPYHLIKFERAATEIIDFNETKFIISNSHEKTGRSISKTEMEWIEIFNRDYLNSDLEYPLSYKFNLLKVKSNNALDLFSLNAFTIRLFCSQNFVDMVNRHGFTGMMFEPLETARYLYYPITEE